MKRRLIYIIALLTTILGGCYDSHNEASSSTFYGADNCDIAELQALAQNGCYEVSRDLICLCRVTSSDSEGNFYRSLVVEDMSGGMEVRLGIYNSFSQYPIGLVVEFHLKGCAVMFDNGVLQVGLPPQEFDALPRELESQILLDKHLVRSEIIEVIEPCKCDIASLEGSACGRFIIIEQLQHAPLEGEEELLEDYSRFVDDNGNVVFLYVSPHADFAAKGMATSTASIQGILYYENVGKELGKQFVIKPRFADDITTTDSHS